MNISLDSNATAILTDLQGFTAAMQSAVAAAMDKQNQLTIGIAQRRYLSGPRPAKLGVVTNRLRGSLNAAPARATATEVISSLGTNVEYAGAHEYGFQGSVTVRAHARNVFRSHQTKGGAVFDPRTGRVKRQASKRVSLLTGQAQVRAHTRQMNVTARPFLAPALADTSKDYGVAVSEAIVLAWNGGRS